MTTQCTNKYTNKQTNAARFHVLCHRWSNGRCRLVKKKHSVSLKRRCEQRRLALQCEKQSSRSSWHLWSGKKKMLSTKHGRKEKPQ